MRNEDNDKGLQKKRDELAHADYRSLERKETKKKRKQRKKKKKENGKN